MASLSAHKADFHWPKLTFLSRLGQRYVAARERQAQFYIDKVLVQLDDEKLTRAVRDLSRQNKR